MAVVEIAAMVEAEIEALVVALEEIEKCLRQRVLHVVRNAKFLLSQMAVDLYTAAIVLKRILQMTQVEEWIETDLAIDDADLRIDKCLTLYVITAETNANFHLCLGKAKRYFVASVLKKKAETHEKIMDSPQLKWKLLMQN